MEPLFRLDRCPDRGRNLKATKNIKKGDLIFCERPLVAFQSVGENTREAWICHYCKAFVGGPDAAIKRRFQSPTEESEYTLSNDEPTQHSHDDFWDDGPRCSKVIPCRHACGHVYCSSACEEDAWSCHHCFLCTGKVESMDHPLVQFKQLAVQSNEILLLVAEWWVAEHLWKANSLSHDSMDDDPFTDFTMELWWDVITQDSPEERDTMTKSLTDLCESAAKLFNLAIDDEKIPPIQAEDIARRVGACEQNAIGIRQRHPLCREVFREEFRAKHHSLLEQCLEESGVVEENGDDENDAGETRTEPQRHYSADELERLIAGLYMDESTSSNTNSMGDDMDALFTPLDGMAMYSTACKMNHSCSPNVVILYKPVGWGSRYPLTLYGVALRDITDGEELTISYINTDCDKEERQALLSNYGFVCECELCNNESLLVEVTLEESKPNTLSDSDSDSSVSSELDNKDEPSLQQRLDQLDASSDDAMTGSVPLVLRGQVRALIYTKTQVLATTLKGEEEELVKVKSLLHQCSLLAQQGKLSKLGRAGTTLASIIYSRAHARKSWFSNDREIYWLACLASSFGLAHRCHLLESLRVLDGAFSVGLPRGDKVVGQFFAVVEFYASMMTRVLRPGLDSEMADFADPSLRHLLDVDPLTFPIVERINLTYDEFIARHVSTSIPVVCKAFARLWPATISWRSIQRFIDGHDSRMVPVELGSMLNGTMTEKMMSLREFVRTFLACASEVVSLQQACNLRSNKIAYLAQHSLLDQIPKLQEFIDVSPPLCGEQGPRERNMWIGPGGTRTPLHFDTYDNILVQIVGAKYVRIYSQTESSKLYRGGGRYGLQNNMSELDCECEDFNKHPLARDAVYTEALLLPGDAIYIPARAWHYVRSLTVSISVNYWFD